MANTIERKHFITKLGIYDNFLRFYRIIDFYFYKPSINFHKIRYRLNTFASQNWEDNQYKKVRLSSFNLRLLNKFKNFVTIKI